MPVRDERLLHLGNLDRAVLLGVDFTSADLGGATFRAAEINHASFSKALLQGTRGSPVLRSRKRSSTAPICRAPC